MARALDFDLAVFDLDGTLYMTELSVVPSIQETFARFGLPVPADAEVRALIGIPTQGYRAWLKERGGELGERIADETPKREYELVRTKGQLFPHARETLEALRKDGCRTVLLTNAGQRYVSTVLGAFGIEPLFDEVSLFRRGELSKAERLAGVIGRAGGVPAIMVGDRKFDFEAAREVGCPSVGVSHGYGGDELALADIVIDDLWELVGMRRAAKGTASSSGARPRGA